MYRTITIVFVACIIFASVSSRAPAPPRVIEARRNIRRCFNDILRKLVYGVNGTTCTDKDDFNRLIENYSEIEKKTFNHTVTANRQSVEVLMFAVNQPYLADFSKNGSCINMTSCVNENIGETVSLVNTPDGTQAPPKKLNIVQMMFDPMEEPKYDKRSCLKAGALRRCAEKEAISKCDNHTAEFFLAFFDYSQRNCLNQITTSRPHSEKPRGSASVFIPASFIMAITAILSLLL